MPSARAFIVAGLLTLLLLVGALRPGLAEAALLGDGLLALAIVADARRGRSSALTALRSTPPILAQGTTTRFALQLSNRSPRELTVVLREALTPAFANCPLRTRLRIPRTQTTRWEYSVTPRHRGEHELGPLTARILGPWGLGWGQRELLPSEKRRIYPQTRWEGLVGRLLALAHRRELGQSPWQVQGLGREPYALREYQSGDPLSRIHWKASARHARLISREESWERGRPLVILLDCARAMVSLDSGRSKLDHALAATLALTRVALGRGDRVTVAAFSDRVERLLRVHASRRGAAEAYATLFDLPARLTEPAYDLGAEAVLRAETRRATVAVFTSVVDLASAELLREALSRLQRRHRVLLINLEDAQLAELAFGSPRDATAAFAKIGALEVMLANRRLARHLRRAGILTVMTSSEHLAERSMDAYLRRSERRGRVRRAPAQSLSVRLRA